MIGYNISLSVSLLKTLKMEIDCATSLRSFVKSLSSQWEESRSGVIVQWLNGWDVETMHNAIRYWCELVDTYLDIGFTSGPRWKTKEDLDLIGSIDIRMPRTMR